MVYNNDHLQNNRTGHGCINAFGWLIAFGIGALFVFILGLALPIFVAGQVLLTPNTYKAALEKSDFYNQFSGLFVEQMVYSDPSLLQMQGLPCVNVAEFNPKDWKLISTQLTPPAWVKVQTESLIDQVFALTGEDQPPPSLWISTLEFKNLLAGDAGFSFYSELIADKHACTFTDLFEITAWAFNPGSGCLTICRPLDEINPIIREILPTLAQSMPDLYDLGPFIGAQPLLEIGRYLEQAQVVKTTALIACVLVFGLLPFTLISSRARSCSGWLRSWGAPFALAGLLITGIALLMPLFAQSGMLDLLRAAGLAPGMLTFVKELAGEIIKSIAISTGLPGLVLFVLGLIMLLVSALASAAQNRSVHRR